MLLVRNTERVQQLRVQYWHEIGEVNLKDLVFVDETGSNLAMTRRYARSFKGSRAYDDAPNPARQQLDPDWCYGTTGTRRRDDLAWSQVTGWFLRPT